MLFEFNIPRVKPSILRRDLFCDGEPICYLLSIYTEEVQRYQIQYGHPTRFAQYQQNKWMQIHPEADEYDAELERTNSCMTSENQSLQYDNKQLNALIKEYEQTLETLMSCVYCLHTPLFLINPDRQLSKSCCMFQPPTNRAHLF